MDSWGKIDSIKIDFFFLPIVTVQNTYMKVDKGMEDHDVSIVAVLVGEKLMLQRISVPTGPPQHKNLCTTSKKCGPKGQQLPYGIELGLDSSNHL